MEVTPGNTHANTPNDNKMTILYNAQNSHSDVDLDEVSSSKDFLWTPWKKDFLSFSKESIQSSK